MKSVPVDRVKMPPHLQQALYGEVWEERPTASNVDQAATLILLAFRRGGRGWADRAAQKLADAGLLRADEVGS